MIERYLTEEMKNIWSEKSKYEFWLRIEIEALKAFREFNPLITLQDIKNIEKNAKINVLRIQEIEKATKHDVVAFTRQISETLGQEKKWIHYGLTSTDVVDSAQSLRLKKVNSIILNSLLELKKILFEKALEHQKTFQIGRTHGIHAEVTTFGYKLLLWHDEIQRQIKRFKRASKNIEVIKISGAVGNFANIPLKIQKIMAKRLKMDYADTSSQTLQRDRHAEYVFSLALIASSLEKFAIEIRHLQRTEVSELSEGVSKGQKGSSAMPHKKNPISSENITGLARIVKGFVYPSLENILLWHERDISHSSVERIVLQDSTSLIHYMLKRFKNLMDDLIVNKEKMLENINLTKGLIFSQRALHLLINKNNWSREKAYDLIQKYSFKAINQKNNFLKLLEQDLIINEQEKKELEDLKYYYQAIKIIFKKRKENYE